MAALQLMLFLYIGLQSFALNAGASQRVPDAVRAKKMIDGIETLCDHLPGPPSTATVCRKEVERLLPLAITLITGVVKPVEVCKLVGLCGSYRDKQGKILSYFAAQALQAAVTSRNEPPMPPCPFCMFLLKKMDDLLPKERTKAEVVSLLAKICDMLPSADQDQCWAFTGTFRRTLLDLIPIRVGPRVICAVTGQCEWQDAAVAASDPCTVTTYRCRDVSTALRCGTLFYCQRFAWKPLDSNKL